MSSRKQLYRRKKYGVFGCNRCHGWQLSNQFQKTHKCPYCGRILRLDKVHIIYETDDPEEAVEYVKELKMRRAQRRGEPELITADKLLDRQFSQGKSL